MGWVSESSYLYVWGNGGGITQKPDTPAPPPDPKPDPEPEPDPDPPVDPPVDPDGPDETGDDESGDDEKKRRKDK